MRRAIARHWYFVYADYCPICTGMKEIRERRLTPRPKKWEDRHETQETYDYCNG